MTIAGVVDTLEEVPEALRDHYEQGTDGKFRLAVQGMVDKSKVDEFRDTNITLKQQLEKFDGLNLDEVKTMREKLAEMDRLDAEKNGDWSKREEQLRTEFATAAQAERKKIDERLALVEGALDEEVRISKATAAIADLKGSTKVLLPHVLKHTKMVEDNGRFTAVVVDEQGRPRIGNTEGGNMSLPQFVESLKQDPDFARVFEGTGSSGGGSAKSAGGQQGTKTISAGDDAAFMQNLEGIADGSVAVQ